MIGFCRVFFISGTNIRHLVLGILWVHSHFCEFTICFNLITVSFILCCTALVYGPSKYQGDFDITTTYIHVWCVIYRYKVYVHNEYTAYIRRDNQLSRFCISKAHSNYCLKLFVQTVLICSRSLGTKGILAGHCGLYNIYKELNLNR